MEITNQKTPAEELAELKEALARGGYGLMRAEKLYVCDISEAHLKEQQKTADVIGQNISLENVLTKAELLVDCSDEDEAIGHRIALREAIRRAKPHADRDSDREPFGLVAKNADRNEIRVIVTGTPGLGRTSVAWAVREALYTHGFQTHVVDRSELVESAGAAAHLNRIAMIQAAETRVIVVVPDRYGSKPA